MEPRREQPRDQQVRTEPKPKRFRLVRLEDRIMPGCGTAPAIGLHPKNTHGNTCACGSGGGTLSVE
jgi:hypothetical protein